MARLMRSRVCVWAPWVSSSVDCSSTGGESRSFIGIWDLENTIRPNFKNIGRLMSNSGRISRRQGEGPGNMGADSRCRSPLPALRPRVAPTTPNTLTDRSVMHADQLKRPNGTNGTPAVLDHARWRRPPCAWSSVQATRVQGVRGCSLLWQLYNIRVIFE